MNTAVLIWIIVGIVVVALIVIGVLYFMRGRTEQRNRAEHEKAEKLREQARQSELAAREGEARAAQAKADAASAAAAAQQAQARAAQSDVEAQRLADSVGEHEAEASKYRAEQEQTLRKADKVDPYVTTDAAGRTTSDTRAATADRTDADVATTRRDAAARDAAAQDAAAQDAAAQDAAAQDAAAQDAAATPEQPITRPPASRPVPTVSRNDASVDGVPETNTDPAARF